LYTPEFQIRIHYIPIRIQPFLKNARSGKISSQFPDAAYGGSSFRNPDLIMKEKVCANFQKCFQSLIYELKKSKYIASNGIKLF
jgi:hypothetical protein